MKDMLVALYDLPKYQEGSFNKSGVKIKRVIAPEKGLVTEFVLKNYNQTWADECEVALTKTPTTCFVAYLDQKVIGFACYDTTMLNFFGPTGVLETYQGLGIGKALLLECLYAMKNNGYAYAIIGGVGPEQFYEKVVGATVIGDSNPGIYLDLLKPT